jgi:hypothetical protein
VPIPSGWGWKWPGCAPLIAPVTWTVRSAATPLPRNVIDVLGDAVGVPGAGYALTVPLASNIEGRGIGSDTCTALADRTVVVVVRYAASAREATRPRSAVATARTVTHDRKRTGLDFRSAVAFRTHTECPVGAQYATVNDAQIRDRPRVDSACALSADRGGQRRLIR